MTKPDLMAELAEVVDELRRGDCNDNECLALANRLNRVHAELEAVVRKAARYDWLRDRFAGADHVRELVEYNHDMHPEMRVEVDAAIDQAMHNSAREG